MCERERGGGEWKSGHGGERPAANDSSHIMSGPSDETASVDTLSIEELRNQLVAERLRSAKLTAENAELKSRLGSFSNASEAEEEFITNGLLKRMNALKASKEELAMAVEQEEEQMTNALMKRVHGLEGQLSTLKAEFDGLKEENRKLGGGM